MDALAPSVDYETGLAALEDLIQRYPTSTQGFAG